MESIYGAGFWSVCHGRKACHVVLYCLDLNNDVPTYLLTNAYQLMGTDYGEPYISPPGHIPFRTSPPDSSPTDILRPFLSFCPHTTFPLHSVCQCELPTCPLYSWMFHYRRLSTVGDRAFLDAVARTWNSLPTEVTSSNSPQTFTTKLKSHLFLASFPLVVILTVNFKVSVK